MITYFTVSVKEVQAWTVLKDATAPQAASVIHSDFVRGFIRTKTIAYDNFIENSGKQAAKKLEKTPVRKGDLAQGRKRTAFQV